MASNKFKIVLVGAGEVGKTTWVKKMRTGDFETKYVATLGVEVHPVRIQTNYGQITFNIWDTAGHPKYGGLRDGYYIQSVGAILMYDAINPNTFDALPDYAQRVNKVCGEIEGVVVVNKCDTAVDMPFTEFDKICISTQDDWNIFEPLVILARKLTGHDDLVLVD